MTGGKGRERLSCQGKAWAEIEVGINVILDITKDLV